MKKAKIIPLQACRAVRKLGEDIHDARRRRRIPTTIMAERASISRTTLVKIEQGNPGVALGNYASVLFALGMVNHLGDVADIRQDETGLALENERLPKRIRPQRHNSGTEA